MRIIVPLLVLGLLILVHELGHFGVAKFFKIKVREFWIFMGPKLFKWKRKETEYSLRLLPIGGMVRMEGEEESSDDDRAFINKPPLVRMAVIAAGPIMNILFALILLTVVFSYSGYATKNIRLDKDLSPAYEAGLREGDKLLKVNGKRVFDPMDYFLFTYLEPGEPFTVEVQRDNEVKEYIINPLPHYRIGIILDSSSPVVLEVDKEMPAYKAGLRDGDRITSINDIAMSSNVEVSEYILKNQDKPLKIQYRRGDEPERTIQVSPEKSGDGYVGMGFSFVGGASEKKASLGGIIKTSINYGVSLTRSTYYSIVWLISGKVPVKELSGPVGIVKTMGDAMESAPGFVDSLMALLQMGALISLSLGLFNLIPFPALDGSKILILFFELITRKKLKPEKEAAISFVGLAILLTFMIVVTFFDVMKFF